MPNTMQSFIVRIKPEAVDDEGQIICWKGSIEHVNKGARHGFTTFAELVRLISVQGRIRGDATLTD